MASLDNPTVASGTVRDAGGAIAYHRDNPCAYGFRERSNGPRPSREVFMPRHDNGRRHNARVAGACPKDKDVYGMLDVPDMIPNGVSNEDKFSRFLDEQDPILRVNQNESQKAFSQSGLRA